LEELHYTLRICATLKFALSVDLLSLLGGLSCWDDDVATYAPRARLDKTCAPSELESLLDELIIKLNKLTKYYSSVSLAFV